MGDTKYPTGQKIDLGIGECWAEVLDDRGSIRVYDEDGGSVALTASEVVGLGEWVQLIGKPPFAQEPSDPEPMPTSIACRRGECEDCDWAPTDECDCGCHPIPAPTSSDVGNDRG